MEDLRAHAQGFAEGGGFHGHDHEFLQIDVVVRMGPAVEDVHHGYGKAAGGRAPEIAVERQIGGGGRRPGTGQRHAEYGIGAEPALVGGAVQIDQVLVDQGLVGRIPSRQGRADLPMNVIYRLEDAFAQVPILVLVAQLHGFVFAGRSPGGNRGPALVAAAETDVYFHGGIAARIENFARGDLVDFAHD